MAVIEMLGFSLERLNKEPELLQADSDRVRRQMLELAVSKYDAFLSAADCTAAVRTEVAGIRQHLQALQQVLSCCGPRSLLCAERLSPLPPRRVCRPSLLAAPTSRRRRSA